MTPKPESPICTYLRNIVRGLIDFEDQMQLVEADSQSTVLIELRVAEADAGKVLGRGGENVAAIRRLLYAFGRKKGLGTVVFNVLNRKS